MAEAGTESGVPDTAVDSVRRTTTPWPGGRVMVEAGTSKVCRELVAEAASAVAVGDEVVAAETAGQAVAAGVVAVIVEDEEPDPPWADEADAVPLLLSTLLRT